MTSSPQSAERFPLHLRPWVALGLAMALGLVMKLLPYLLVAVGVRFELFGDVYPWGFTPLLAVGLFCGYLVRDLRVAIGVMLGFLVLSDIALGAVTGQVTWAFYTTQAINYLCLLATVPLGNWLRTGADSQPSGKTSSYGLSLFTCIGACVLFFVVTNFVSWLTMVEYTKDLAGFVRCYTLAIPFFRNMLLGNTLYTAILLSPVMLRALYPAGQTTVGLALERETV